MEDRKTKGTTESAIACILNSIQEAKVAVAALLSNDVDPVDDQGQYSVSLARQHISDAEHAVQVRSLRAVIYGMWHLTRRDFRRNCERLDAVN